METKIRDALQKLDLSSDAVWTSDGLPRLDAPGLGGKFSRADVTAAAPLFSRTRPDLSAAPSSIEDEDGIEEIDGDARAAEQLSTVFQMQASDFGDGSEPTASAVSQEPSVPMDQLIQAAQRSLALANEAAEQAERLKRDAAEARDKAVREQQRIDDSDPHRIQKGIMAYLASTQQKGKTEGPAAPASAASPLDKAMQQRRPAFGTKRPAYPTQR